MIEVILAVAGLLAFLAAVLIVAIVLLTRRLWQLMASVECLCTNLGGLRAQIGHGGHEHAD